LQLINELDAQVAGNATLKSFILWMPIPIISGECLFKEVQVEWALKRDKADTQQKNKGVFHLKKYYWINLHLEINTSFYKNFKCSW
jgi:hypothetical protein